MKMPFYERMQLHGLVEILFSYFMKQARLKSAVRDNRISNLLNYIQQHISEVITIDDLAEKACQTKSHLIRSFSKIMGITPLQYILQKKIQHAQSLLLSTDMTVSKISEATGFNDVSYFIRLFKKNIGFTPQEYREKLIG
jgi:transcriptional regulator GlxA family with amidase domain